MKILVLSDSHSALQFMFQAVDAILPDAIIHLGDYFDDGETLHEEYPEIPFYQVPGNCDCFRCDPSVPQILIEEIFGVRFYLTHGHRHDVKRTTRLLEADARDSKVDAVLYGHTHIADCRQEQGMWILNPGTCGYGERTGGVIEIEDRKIVACYVIRQADLEGRA